MTTYVYNEHDENQVLTMRNKLKKKKRKRRINFVLIVLFLIFLVIFLFGDMSKVKKITVSGCHLTSAEEIIERLPVKSKQTYFFKVNKKQVETEVEKMIFVEKATVTKDLIGNIKIRIKENNASLYGYINNILYVADQDGIFEQDQQQKWISYVQRCPQMMNFDEEHFQSFVKAYVKLPSVVQNQMSLNLMKKIKPNVSWNLMMVRFFMYVLKTWKNNLHQQIITWLFKVILIINTMII